MIRPAEGMAGRVMRAVGLGVLLALGVAGVASAKGTPYFGIEISPLQPIEGEAVVVVVRTWEDVAHTVPARDVAAATLNGLIVLRSAAGDRPDIAISLSSQAPGEFRATFVVPGPGEWELVAFPDRTGWASPVVPAGYPDAIAIGVRAQDGGAAIIAPVAGFAALVLILGGALIVALRVQRGQSGSVVRSSESG